MVGPSCPSDARLRDFDRGELADPELEEISSHFANCRECLERMHRLAVPLGGLSIAPEVGSDAAEPDDDAYRNAVARVAVLPNGPKAPAAGDTIRDYRLLERIGSGGMGIVFRAVHEKLDRIVALKLVSRLRWHDPRALARFAREVRAVGRLDHPNIVRATDAGEVDGLPFLVMEYVDGENLAARSKREGPLTVAAACALLRPAAVGLHHAHLAGLVHRDVKPSNLIRACDGTVKVLDLGLALSLADAELSGEAVAFAHEAEGETRFTTASRGVGTPFFMAPEQMRNPHAVDARADVYGLGCTLWFLLTGSPPPPEPLQSQTPGGLGHEFWKRFLSPDLDDRHADMAAVAETLATVGKPRWRRPAMLAGVASVAALGLAFLTVPGESPTPVVLASPSLEVAPPPRPAPPAPGQNPMTVTEAQELQQRWAEYLGEKVFETGPAKVKTVLIPPGSFEMYPRYRVAISKPFRLGVTEVTRAQFEAFVDATEYQTTGELAGPLKPLGVVIGPKQDSANWRKPGYAPGPDHPMTHASHADAIAFVDWLSRIEGKAYRLPSEAEWRWACRAGSIARYPFGDDPAPLREYANYKLYGMTSPGRVGVRRANVWGLCDMLGNVREWVQDGFAPIREGEFVDPVVGPSPQGYRVWCGGDFNSRADVPNVVGWMSSTCDCSTRGGNHWYFVGPTMGFRVCRDP